MGRKLQCHRQEDVSYYSDAKPGQNWHIHSKAEERRHWLVECLAFFFFLFLCFLILKICLSLLWPEGQVKKVQGPVEEGTWVMGAHFC